jgi:hypothetical protein
LNPKTAIYGSAAPTGRVRVDGKPLPGELVEYGLPVDCVSDEGAIVDDIIKPRTSCASLDEDGPGDL